MARDFPTFSTAAVLLLAAGLSACAGHHGRSKHPVPPQLLYSPNGEPLNGGPLGTPPCDAAMAGWFDRIDANHDGRVDREEFLADARAQFARMDVEHYGYLTSEELDRYRAPYRRGTRIPPGGGNDPVMSADSDLDFKVTPEEFAAQAAETFKRLAGPDGTIGRDRLPSLCKAPSSSEPPPSGEGRPHRGGAGPSG